MTDLLILEQHAVYDECNLVSKYFLLPKEEPKLMLAQNGGAETKVVETTTLSKETGGSSTDEQLYNRIVILEKKILPKGPTPGPNMSDSVASVFRDVCKLGCYSATFKWVPSEYYSWELGRRAETLGAERIGQLTKAMLMENTRLKGEESLGVLNRGLRGDFDLKLGTGSI